MSLSARRILVTGASRGIGAACAKAFAAQGAHVYAADVLSCEQTVSDITDSEGVAESLTLDVSDEQSVLELFSQTIAPRGLDYLVHSAGIIHEKALIETTVDDFDRVIAVNLRGSFLVGREALRLFNRQKHGRVIMIASDLGRIGRATFSSYVASKHGVIGLVRSWAHEFGPIINVNAISPGPIDTAMLDADHMSDEWREKEMNIPLGRFGQPDEVASMALYLCGPGGDFITGQSIGVNGGSEMC